MSKDVQSMMRASHLGLRSAVVGAALTADLVARNDAFKLELAEWSRREMTVSLVKPVWSLLPNPVLPRTTFQRKVERVPIIARDLAGTKSSDSRHHLTCRVRRAKDADRRNPPCPLGRRTCRGCRSRPRRAGRCRREV